MANCYCTIKNELRGKKLSVTKIAILLIFS